MNIQSLTTQPSQPTYHWDNLDVVDASENTLVTDEQERLRALHEYKTTDSVLGYWITPDFNDGDFDEGEEFQVDWIGFPRYKQSRKGAGNPNPAPNQQKAAAARRKGVTARKAISATIDQDVLEHLTIYASDNDLSRSDVINIALEAYLPTAE